MNANTLFITLSTLLFFSCGQTDPNKQIDEGNVKGATYTSNEIGWSINIPDDWKIVSKDKVEDNDEKGKIALEKSMGEDIDIKGFKHLISFQKDRFNMFASTSEPFTEEFPGEYEQNNKALNEIMFNTFAEQGIKVDTASGTEKIQGILFNTFYTTIYGPDGKIILNQVLYSQLINGYDFGVNINFTNEQDKKTMTNAWKHSIFTKK